MAPMFFFLLLSLVHTIFVEIAESDNTTGLLSIETGESSPHLTLVTFPKHVLPFLRNIPTYKILKENEKITAAFYSEEPLSLDIKYEKLLSKIIDLDYKIERGFKFEPVLVVKRKTVIRSNIVTDIFPVPDFSAPFISFSTCGAVFGLIFNLFINKL